MGDIFFILRMFIYTFVIVIVMQIKIGSTTVEEKVIQWTHQSQMASTLQGVAQGAATFVGIQYKKVVGDINSKYINNHSLDQQPGHRLREKINKLKKSINKRLDSKDEASQSTKDPI